jgi:SPP1 gp7 family putative phage head morphogenesis protein
MFEFSEEYINDLFKRIFNGEITEYELPESLYHSIADYLKKGAYKGYGIDFKTLTKEINEGLVSEFTESDLELLTNLRENIYMFSAAKTYQQVKEMTEALVNEKGTVVSFGEFKEAAGEIFDLYNSTWLKTEYDTAIGQAQESVKWESIEKNKEVLPYLRYSAVMDANTSEICAPLDGIVAPVDDPIWNTIAPLNHFNCRCLLEQLDKEEGEKKETPDGEKNEKVNEVKGEMQDVFKMNAGKDGYIFKDDHPYFHVPKGDVEFAQNNFDLPIPKKD